MNTFVKYPQRQDCDLKLSAGNSGETSINLSTDIAIFLNDDKVLSKGDEVPISFIIYREDFIKALVDHEVGHHIYYQTIIQNPLKAYRQYQAPYPYT